MTSFVTAIVGFVVGIATGALLWWAGSDAYLRVPGSLWLMLILAVVGIGLLTARSAKPPSAPERRPWILPVALLGSVLVGIGRCEGPASRWPELFNIDFEGFGFVYVASVTVFFMASRRAVLAHRATDPKAVFHFLIALASVGLSSLTSAAILYVE